MSLPSLNKVIIIIIIITITSKLRALGLRPRAFICFSVFGIPDETLALVFDILLECFTQNKQE